MAYGEKGTDSLVEAADYNGLSARVRRVYHDTFDEGNVVNEANDPSYGYGSKTITVATGVSDIADVSASEWITLVQAIIACQDHQAEVVGQTRIDFLIDGISDPSLPTDPTDDDTNYEIAVGEIIRHFDKLEKAVEEIELNDPKNRFLIDDIPTAPDYDGLVSLGGSLRPNTNPWGGYAPGAEPPIVNVGQIKHEFIVNFPTLQILREFFNVGSELEITGSNGEPVGDLSEQWSLGLQGMGAVTFNWAGITNDGSNDNANGNVIYPSSGRSTLGVYDLYNLMIEGTDNGLTKIFEYSIGASVGGGSSLYAEETVLMEAMMEVATQSGLQGYNLRFLVRYSSNPGGVSVEEVVGNITSNVSYRMIRGDSTIDRKPDDPNILYHVAHGLNDGEENPLSET